MTLSVLLSHTTLMEGRDAFCLTQSHYTDGGS